MIVSILGASAALGGLILVFLGLVIGAYQAYPADTPKAVKERASQAGTPILATFILSVISVALALLWLLIPGGNSLYWGSVAVFVADLVAIVGVAVRTTVRLLR